MLTIKHYIWSTDEIHSKPNFDKYIAVPCLSGIWVLRQGTGYRASTLLYYISLLPGSPTLHNHLMAIDHCLWFCYNFLSAPQSWHLLLNSDITPPAGKSVSFGGVKPKKICKKNCGSIMSTKNKFCIKTAISALSSGPSNLQKPIWGRHHEQDDQHRNTNIKNKDHLVGD